ncbi:MAG: hypothetical protein WEC34_15890 [Acidimicrobiia bacterium]
MDRPFDSAWLKWGRAVVHYHALEAEVTNYIANPDRHEYFLRWGDYDAKRHGFPITIASFTPWPTHWGVLLGDVVFNYRSALDHIAWAVVGRGRRAGTLTEKEARNVYFPVVGTNAADFKRETVVKLIGARREDLALVRKTQPYLRGKRRAQRHVFTILNDLSIVDKHRTIQPVQTITMRGSYTILKMVRCEETRDTRQPRERRAVMEVGAEIGIVRVRKTGPDPEIDVGVTLDFTPGITPTNRLDEWLQVTGQLIRNLLIHLDPEPPNEIAQLGDPTWFFPPGQIPPHLRPPPAHGEHFPDAGHSL